MPRKPGKPRPSEAVDRMIADARCAELYSQGLTLRQIAEREGCGASTVHSAIERAVAAVPIPAVEALRAVQLDSLTLQKRIVLQILANPPVKVDHGKVIYEPMVEGQTGPPRPMIDQDVRLRASAELRRIEDSMARLTGTRVPIVHEVHEITEDALDAELKRLTVQLGNNDQGGEGPGHSPVEAPGERAAEAAVG